MLMTLRWGVCSTPGKAVRWHRITAACEVLSIRIRMKRQPWRLWRFYVDLEHMTKSLHQKQYSRLPLNGSFF